MALTPISKELKREISRDLEQYHRVFDVFWSLSSIFFTPAKHKIKTAAVYFPANGRCRMLINQAFWDELNADEKLFVILHECMHVLLDHGLRNAKNYPGATARLVNIAQDITINEMIIDLFGFLRSTIRGWERFCWIDTCFKDTSTIERNQVFMYYLKELIARGEEPEVETLDDHSAGDGDDDDDGSDPEGNDNTGDPDAFAKDLARELSDAELEAMLEKMAPERGRGFGLSPYRIILKSREPAPINFDDMVKGLVRTAKLKNARELSSFAHEDRRFGSLRSDMLLPGREPAKPNPQKLNALVFFDVSGSCMPYLHKLNSVRLAFEKEKNLFVVRSYAFDTRVTLVQPDEPLAVGGGTSFDIIEDECQRVMREEGRYPDCVVVITDGAGNTVMPEYPGRWVFLLTPRATRDYVPSRAKAWPITNVKF